MKKFCLIFFLSVSCFFCGAEAPVFYRAEAVKEYPHDTGSYTQGLFFRGDTLMESSGGYGKSFFRKEKLETASGYAEKKFARKYFIEGSVILDGKLYILTWQSKVLFVYDPDSLTYLKTYSYPREGWGLTTDGKSLIASDGTSDLFFMTPELKLEKRLTVTMNGKPLRLLNELEWIDGKIWANIYTTDTVIIINPENGCVEGVVDCSGLLPERLRKPDTDVLNGIAFRAGHIYLTGKNWPRLYEIRLLRK